MLLSRSGIIAAAGGAPPTSAPVFDGFAVQVADLGSVASKTVTITDATGILWLGMVGARVAQTTATIQNPASWDAPSINASHSAESAMQIKVWARLLAGTESNPQFGMELAGTPVATDEWGCAVIAVAGAAGAGYIHQVATTNNLSSASPVCPTVTTTVPNCLIVRGFLSRAVQTAEDANYPADTTGIFLKRVLGAENIHVIGAAYHTQAGAGATGTAEFTGAMSGSDRYIAFTVAISP